MRIMDTMRKVVEALPKLAAKVLKLIVNNIKKCFNVLTDTATKIFEGIKTSLKWLSESFVDPRGKVNSILKDPQKSDGVKAMEVTGVIATGILWTLLVSFGFAMLGLDCINAVLAVLSVLSLIATAGVAFHSIWKERRLKSNDSTMQASKAQY